jgi:hypothetical protein
LGYGAVVSLFFFFTLYEVIYTAMGYTLYGGPLHYTLFGFSERWDGALKQEWAMHIDEDSSQNTFLAMHIVFLGRT